MTDAETRLDWFQNARWGVFTHFLADSASARGAPMLDVETWNQRVDRFDVDAFARQLATAGAGYCCITLGQNSGFYCSPNSTYDRFTAIEPTKLSRRDLIADLSTALNPHGIRLMVYLPAGAPENDEAASRALEWQKGPHRNAAFQRKWEQVIHEWSTRWGARVSGWWFDGCYWPDAMYNVPSPPNWGSFIFAVRSGNPGAIVAFNTGALVAHQPRPKRLNEGLLPGSGEDYTAGELDFALPVAGRLYDGSQVWPGRWVDGAQLHFLTFLGEWWGQGEPRFPDELVVGYTKHVNAHGGVISWDMPCGPDGLIPAPFMNQLLALKQGTR